MLPLVGGSRRDGRCCGMRPASVTDDVNDYSDGLIGTVMKVPLGGSPVVILVARVS